MVNLPVRIAIAVFATSVIGLLGASNVFPNVWSTPEQRGMWYFDRGEFENAANEFRDPLWQGIALYRAGNFKQAEQCFSRSTNPISLFNRANSLVLLGKYEPAIEQYDSALEAKPGWSDAEINRSVAVARAAAVEQTGDDAGDQRIGADEIVFDKSKDSGGQDTETEEGDKLTDASFQATWLKRVQTKPAEFLKAKFAYQYQFGGQDAKEVNDD